MSPAPQLTPAAKEALRKTIRGLRSSLCAQLKEDAERVYRLGVPLDKAKLTDALGQRRARLEEWADEQTRSAGKSGKKLSEKQLAALRARHLERALQEAAHTLVNRLVILRILEASGLCKPAVLTGGWKSPGYGEFVEFAQEVCGDPADETKGYWALLNLVFDDLSVELPGLFGPVGLTSLFPVSSPALRSVVEALNDSSLDSAWGDDTTLGWVYQFWNDPERELLDDKINGGGKIEPHEIASKTQMFTERYMVEWLLQNSLGQTWLALCKQHGWTPEFESVRGALDARRAEWRKKRDSGEVAPDELMPLHSVLENNWKYWVPQPLPEDAPASAPSSLRELKLLDPACGSGHFLVIAFELLTALYREEARQRAESWSDEQIARWIVEDNLHGIDIDPRAIQIAAAAVWLKAKTFAPGARLTRLNLVAPTFQLGALPADDPALLRLQAELKREVGIPPELTQKLVAALSGVDHLGTLLRVDRSIHEALKSFSQNTKGLTVAAQGDLFRGMPPAQLKLTLEKAKESVLAQLGVFLAAHEGEGDLGLRLEGEQLAAGIRFVQIAQEGRYDLVVGNPPYQGTSKMAQAEWFKKHYPRGKADLYACFLERGLELAKPGGVSALLTMRGWMFLSQYTALREFLTQEKRVAALGDVGWGAFRDMKDNPVTMSIVVNSGTREHSVALAPTGTTERSRTFENYQLIIFGLLAQVGRYEFDVAQLAGIEGTPLVYWWDEEFLAEYVKAPKLGEVAPVRKGIDTGNNSRLVRRPWEIAPFAPEQSVDMVWAPYVMGGKGAAWCEPLANVVRWRSDGLAIRVAAETSAGSTIRNPGCFFAKGVAFTPIGADFQARIHRFASICDNMGSSVFPSNCAAICCTLSAQRAKVVLSSLNPGIHFQVGDVNRLPLFIPIGTAAIGAALMHAFTLHESHREPSIEFKQPGPSPWRAAQDWAQRAVDRPKGEPLPPYEPEFDAPEPAAFVSFAVGVALGRFGENGEGILDLTLPAGAATSRVHPKQTHLQNPPRDVASAEAVDAAVSDAPSGAVSTDTTPHIEPSPLPEGQEILPAGILFVSSAHNVADSLGHSAAERIAEAWGEHGAAATGKPTELRDWLRKDFFAYHKSLYENRPIYFPLSSSGKNFVAFVSIHRWADDTLKALLAHHLHPAREKLSGEIHDLNAARATSDAGQKAKADKQYVKSQKLFEELEEFIALVTQCAEKGAPPTDPKCTPREVDAPFVMDLDDGVMINSAALWPLLAPQWSDPKKWWKELCAADGRKDYDWAHLAARYFPKRARDKCQTDPSLAVAHGCFWRYHPAKAFAWELRLQEEIGPDFTIDEGARWGDFAWNDGTQYGPRGASDRYRDAFLREQPQLAAELRAKEEQRRERNRKKASASEADSDGPLYAGEKAG